jgi:hypothetical protein
MEVECLRHIQRAVHILEMITHATRRLEQQMNNEEEKKGMNICLKKALMEVGQKSSYLQ